MSSSTSDKGAPSPARRSRLRLSKPAWSLLAAAGAFILAIAFAVPAMAVLTGSPSNFEANDGNMVVDTTGHNDWNSVQGSGNYVHLTDLSSTTKDDSFQSGQKQDAPCPTINTNKNPPKDDFTDVASYNETNVDSTSQQFNHTYLDGATIRFTANGNASENVELNQGTSGTCANDNTLLQRTAGDKLIAIDYLNGGTNVQFHVLTWVGSGACFVKTDTAPCWGATVQTLAANAAEGQVNQDAITAANNKISGVDLVAGQFAEFGVDLTAAGIIPSTSCSAFAQTIWESRASGSSFVSSTEDVSVEHHTISNCGAIHVVKTTVPAGSSQSFGYTTTGSLSPSTFSLTGQSGHNQENYTSLLPGTYTVTESATSGWALTDLTCNTGGTADKSTATATFNVTVGSDITCTFTNTQQLGALKITKTSVKSSTAVLSGAQFSIKDPSGTALSGSPFTTNSSGVVCVDGLAPGNYSVQETAAPTGYSIDDTTVHTVGVTATSATCAAATFSGQSLSFTDTPLTTITASATSQATGGTQSTVTCVAGTASSTTNVGNSPQGPAASPSVTASDLAPGTYTCTIVVDP